MISEHGAQSHSARMQNCLMTEATEAAMTVHNLNLLSNDNVAENRKEGKNGGKGRFTVDDKKRHMIDLEAISEISYPGAAFVGMGHDNDFVATIDELLESGLG